MKKSTLFITIPPLVTLALGLVQPLHAATNSLPASIAAASGSGSEPGFVVRTVQGPETPALANSFVRATRQLNGTLRDADGALVPSESIPGANANGTYSLDTINFEKDATPIDVLGADGTVVASFTPGLFPGIPGTNSHTVNFATEVITYLDLPAGDHTFGISVGTDRTDVNNDDSYQLFTSANPRDFFGLKVGDFERFTPPFTSDTHNENQFTLSVPAAGLYPFRLLYWQTGLGANLQWYSYLSATDERILVNDLNDPRAIKAFQKTTDPRAGSPYIAEVSPLPGSAANPATTPITFLLSDGVRTLNTNSVKLFLNGAQVTPQRRAKTGSSYLVEYDANATRTNPENLIRVEYADANGGKYTNQWSFQISTLGGANTQVTGQWDFDQGDLRATIGAPLTYLNSEPAIIAKTTFGTTDSLSIDGIKGKPAKVISIPGDLDRKIGYVMTHGIQPNGGGTRVNQFTLIMDIYVETSGSGAASLLQVNSLNNSDDGDLFWQDSNFGQGTDGYIGTKAFTAGEWHRIAAAYDMAATPPVVTKYVDGIKQHDWTANQGLDAARRALLPTAILFGDGDQDERRPMYVNSIQIRSGKLSDAQLALLGGPSANGIPQDLPESNVTGQWDFNNGTLAATIGKDLQYFDGAEGATKQGTLFGLASALGAPLLGEEDPKVMYVPGDVIREIGYVMPHGIAPNGGGTKVNQFTLIMDVVVGTGGPGAASILQVSSLSNTDDGDLFWQDSNFGQGTDGYIGTKAFTSGEWHRVVAAYDMAANPPVVVKYVDGIFQHNWITGHGIDAARRALQPTALLFADGDQDERREWWVNSIQIRPGRLSNEDIEALGGPSTAGIPVAVPRPPALKITRAGNNITILWPEEIEGFVLESSPAVFPAVWTTVTGVANNTVTMPAAATARFFRLRK